MSELPNGWSEPKIDDLRSREPNSITDGPYGSNLKSSHYTASGPTVVRLGNIGSREYIDDDRAHISPEHFASLQKHHVFAGDIVVAALGDPIGRACLIPDAVGPALVKADCFRFRPSADFDPTYLMLWLNSEDARAKFRAVSHGLGRVRINLSDFRNVRAPVAPLPEQRRIVVKIDSLSAKSSRARDHLDHMPRLVEKYKQAILATTLLKFGGDDALGQLSDVISSTFYGPRFAKDSYANDGVMTLRTTDFDGDGNVRLKSPPSVRISKAEFAKWGLVDGDLLVTRTGSIGKCAIYAETVGPALPSAYLIRVRLRLDRVRPRYVLFFLLSRFGQEQLGLGITAVTQPNINAGVIERLKLPIPDLESQDRAIHSIETAFAWIGRLASEATSARKLIDHLDQAILAKAFRGDLVPQDPNDEPASALLERIREERAKAAPKGKRKTA